MFRRFILTVTSAKKAALRCYANQSIERSTTRSMKESLGKNGFKLIIAMLTIGFFLETEKKRVRKDEHLILLGLANSGIDQVDTALLKTGSTKVLSKQKNGEEKPIMKEKVGSNQEHGRKLKITKIYLDHVNELNEDLKLLHINDQYSVVCCFPASGGCSKQHYKLLKPFLRYRQREECSKVYIVFTRSDDITTNDQECIQSMQKYDLFNEWKDQSLFFNTGKTEDANQNAKTVKELIKPISGKYFRSQVYAALAFFFLPHLYFFLKI